MLLLMCIGHHAGTQETRFLLVEDIPVKGLDVKDPGLIADDLVDAMLRGYGHLEERCLFRSICCAVASYSQQAAATRVGPHCHAAAA